ARPAPPTPAAPADGGPEPVLRSREVVLDPAVVAGPAADIALFDDVAVRLVATEREERPDDLAWRGRVEQQDVVTGAATLSVVDGSVFATIVVDDRTFRIEPVGGGVSRVSELGRAPVPDAAPDVVADAEEPPSAAGPDPAAPAATAPASPTVDVLVVYTARARRAVPDIGALITAAVNDTNSAYANSGIGQRIALAGVEEVAYVESGTDASVDLGRLQRNGDGFLDDIHVLRDAVGADLVSLWGEGYTSVCGVGYLQNPAGAGFAPFGFNVMNIRCQNYVLAHELGHNMGARHDWDTDDRNGPFTFNHGYLDQAHDFRTIMAYDSSGCPGGSCARIPYFSNPDVTWSGHPVGVPEGSPRAADNRRTFASTAAGVAAFRAAGAPQRVPVDFDGDGRSDIAVYRPATGEWLVRGRPPVRWGESGDIPVPADYDGDGLSDIAVYRPATGQWFVKDQAVVQWGVPGDVPVVADYDGDGRADPAVFRPSTAQWWVTGRSPVVWGLAGDVPVPEDFDLDGRADLVVFRPADRTWWVRGQFSSVWGDTGDVPVPGDFDGDGRSDLAVFRPSAGQWWRKGRPPVQWGEPGDVPVPGNFDGDRDADMAVYRPATGQWWRDGEAAVQWGMPGDLPLGLPAPLQAMAAVS
ncbi:MAG: M12 family metallo-peptidase, partial [Acidimicrobiales bacterium]